jgi:hypothetical protein
MTRLASLFSEAGLFTLFAVLAVVLLAVGLAPSALAWIYVKPYVMAECPTWTIPFAAIAVFYVQILWGLFILRALGVESFFDDDEEDEDLDSLFSLRRHNSGSSRPGMFAPPAAYKYDTLD